MYPYLAHTVARSSEGGGHADGTGSAAADPGEDSDNYKYTLFAVINHIGNMDQGHYTNFIRLASQVCMVEIWETGDGGRRVLSVSGERL